MILAASRLHCSAKSASQSQGVPQVRIDRCLSRRSFWTCYPCSTPRVRGNQAAWAASKAAAGSIPACAGEPWVGASDADMQLVYPRVCGGTYSATRNSSYVRGLSPRVRGNPSFRLYSCPPLRSIPACAGEPDQHGKDRILMGGNPRVCGGTPTTSACKVGCCGEPPRVRGNR